MPDLQRRKQIEVEESLDRLAFYLDDLFRIPGVGWRFGLDALVGLIPNVGDTLTLLPSFYILLSGVRYGVPKITLLRMALNLGIDYVIGAIPFLGDAFDFVWRANDRNMNLIRTRGAGQGQGKTSDYIFVFGLMSLLLLILVGSVLASTLILWWVITSRPWL